VSTSLAPPAHPGHSRAITELFGPACEAVKVAEPSLRKADQKKLQAAFVHMTDASRAPSSPST